MIERPYEILILDDLISGSYNAVLKKTENEAKLGDLLKMIELRRKLTPNAEEQKQFWAMLESVRQKHQSKKEIEATESLTNSETSNLERGESSDEE